MQNVFIEVTNGPQNWGKFMVARFDEEWSRKSAVDTACPVCGSIDRNLVKIECLKLPVPHEHPWHTSPLLRTIGFGSHNIIVFDLQTQEGAAFTPGGLASADLNKHKIWVCPMFEPFLAWLYKQDLSDLTKLPKHVDLPDAPFAMQGYRREGKK